MSRLLLLHHLGLGDHFMCHGIVRDYASRYGRITIFSYPHNYPTVSFMFRDLPNVELRQVGSVEEAQAYVHDHGAEYDETKILGFGNLDRERGVPLEKQFYDQAGVPFGKRWSAFKVNRDLAREEALYARIAPPGPYAFLHEDPSRKYLIKRSRAGTLPLVIPDPQVAQNLFDYCTLIERAKEIHVIDSSFLFLIDSLPYENSAQKLVVHRYARENNDWQLPVLRKDWHILTAAPSIFDPLRTVLERAYRSTAFPFGTKLFKRSVRWFFRQMLWTMGRPPVLEMKPLVRRYVPERSFAEIGSARYREEAMAAGATSAVSASLPNVHADVVLYRGDPVPVLPELRKATTIILMLVGQFPGNIDEALEKAGFGVRERHVFRKGDSCLICRAL